MGKVTPHLWIAENQQVTVIGVRMKSCFTWILGLHFSKVTEKSKTIRYIIPLRDSKKKNYIDFFLLLPAYQEMTHLKYIVKNMRQNEP